MTFSGITASITNSAKSMNGLAQQIGTQLKTQFAPTIDKINDGIDVLKAGQDVVSTVVKDVTGQDVTIRSIQKGAADFDKKWDDFAKEVNEKFNNAQSSDQADILETFIKSHFGDNVYNLGSAIKNELPVVLDSIADYKDAIDSLKSSSKTAEEAAVKIQKGVNKIVEATQKVTGSLNKAVVICTGNGLPILDDLSKIGGSVAVGNLKKIIGVGVSGATAATTFNEMKDAAKNKDFKGITDAMAKGATAVDKLLSDLGNMVPGFPKAQIPSQITASISRLQNGQSVYDAARSMITALVVNTSGPITPKTLASLTSDFNKNWDTFSDKINALFNVSPANGQTAVLETLGKNMFGPNVFNAAGAIKRQLPGVLEGVAGVQDALKQFGGSYRNPIEAATKIRNGVEKMVQSIERIGQSLNNMVKHYQGNGIMANGTGYPLLDTLEKLGDTKGIQALDTTLRVCGGVAAVADNAGAVAQAIKNKDIPGAIVAVKKTVDDVQKLTKKGNNKIDDSQGAKSGLPNNSSKASDVSNNDPQNSPKNKNNLSSAATDSYVCSTATMKCTMGTSQAKLTVLPTRTVFLTGKPMANISDHLTMVNLAPFGRCRSMGFPATASATAANYGTLTPMPCMHNTPFPWMGGKNDYIIKGDPALLKSSTCQCMWGGTISIIIDGQSSSALADMSRKPAESFSIKQVNRRATPIRVTDNIPIENTVSSQVYQAAGKGNSKKTEATPYTEAEKHYKELCNIDLKKLDGLPNSWINAYNQAVRNIKANYSTGGITSVYSDVELAHNIYKLATNKDAKKLGYDNISYKMPHQVFDIADKVSGFTKYLPSKHFWDSFDKYVPLYTNIDSGAYFSPYYNCVVISMSDDDNVDRMNDSDWFKAGLLHHEFGHAYDHSKGWSNDPEFKALYADFKKEMVKSNIEENLLKYIDDNTKFQHFYSLTRTLSSDETEKLMALSDCLQAATDDHESIPPGGHDEDYFASENKQMAEFIAHMSENYWSGNDLYEQLAPETYAKMRALLEKKWGAKP